MKDTKKVATKNTKITKDLGGLRGSALLRSPLPGISDLLLLVAPLGIQLTGDLAAQARRVGHHFVEAGQEFGQPFRRKRVVVGHPAGNDTGRHAYGKAQLSMLSARCAVRAAAHHWTETAARAGGPARTAPSSSRVRHAPAPARFRCERGRPPRSGRESVQTTSVPV